MRVTLYCVPLLIAATLAQAESLRCDPAVVHPGGTVVLRIEVPHGRELGVRDPSGNFKWISYEKMSANEPDPPISPAAFRENREHKFLVDTAVGIPVPTDSAKPERLFSKPGKYQFLISDNLETERPPRLLKCTVTYRQR